MKLGSGPGGFPLARFEDHRSLEDAIAVFQQRIKDAEAIYNKYHKDFTIRPCPVCGSSSYRGRDRFHGTYEVAQCSVCASLYVNPVPTLVALEDYYNNSTCNTISQELLRRKKSTTFDPVMDDRIEVITRYLSGIRSRPVRILEIGCGSGVLLSRLHKAIANDSDPSEVKLFGVDIDESAIQTCDDRELELFALPVEEFATLSPEPFDIVLHFELIEHLIDPFSFMTATKGLLREEGFMIFRTPNAQGLEMLAADYNSLRLLAHSIFPPMHLNAFSTVNITHFAIRSGFRVLEIDTPGKLDVDMVSLMKDYVTDSGLRNLTGLDDNTKGLFQYLVALLKASSHMQCVLQPG